MHGKQNIRKSHYRSISPLTVTDGDSPTHKACCVQIKFCISLCQFQIYKFGRPTALVGLAQRILTFKYGTQLPKITNIRFFF